MSRLDLEHGAWRGSHWWVSQFNFDPSAYQREEIPEQVAFHDSTLRDGEQAAGVVFSPDQKLQLARMLDKAGIQFIEAGFPAVSHQEAESLKRIAHAGLNAKITCLSRAMEADIDLAASCGVWGAIVEIPVSYPRLKYQFGWEESRVLEKARRILTYAKEKGLHVFLFMIDSTRAHIEFLEELITTLSKECAPDKFSLVDTNGCVSPEGMGMLVRKASGWTEIPIEVHCHNDFGLGVANSIASLKNGARSVSATVSGLGQRAGNANLEELIMALECLYGVRTGIDLEKLYEVSCQVREWSGWSFPPNSPVVGKNLFTWEGGIPTAALMKNPYTVEPIQPELFGRKHDVLVGKKSGKANLIWKAKELGLSIPEEKLSQALDAAKETSSRLGRTLNDEECKALIESMN